MRLVQETDEDWWEVEALYDLCFAPGREALSSYRLRQTNGPIADLSLLARDETGSVSGAIRYWPVLIEESPALLLGPVAVHPIHQGEGLGALLIEQSLTLAQMWSRVMLVGDAPYYGRFGFEHLPRVIMPPPTNPERVLGRALVPGAWDDVAGPVRAWDGRAI